MMIFSMDFVLTGLAFLFGVGLVVVSNIVDRRRRANFTPGGLPALPVMFAGTIIALLAAVHLITLFRGNR